MQRGSPPGHARERKRHRKGEGTRRQRSARRVSSLGMPERERGIERGRGPGGKEVPGGSPPWECQREKKA